MSTQQQPDIQLEFFDDSNQNAQPDTKTPTRRRSAFDDLGFRDTIAVLQDEIRALYTADEVPWVIGYSGGKDSTATLQLIWSAVAQLPPEQRRKTIHVISTDTLVENPIVSAWVAKSIKVMRKAASEQQMPVEARLLRPKLADTFWVNLIGRGYPAPRHKFRWCTERLKIRPSNSFISDVVTRNGEAILCLGARKNESVARARVFAKTARYRARDRLSPSETLAGCLIYTPVEDWTSDDIWFFLNNEKNPWGIHNKELMGLYAGASPDGECPLVVDQSTPSCGDSRFGCWVCTLVEQDKSMTAMIQNDIDKEWMMPLLDLRNQLDARNQGEKADKASDHHLRDFRRMTGAVQIMSSGDPVPGPYTQEARADWLLRLLKAQTHARKAGPPEFQDIELISLDELQEIRRIWVVDKHEMEDILPDLYRKATGKNYPGRPLDDNLAIGAEEMQMLREICGEDRHHYELTRELLSVTRQQRNSGRRAGLQQRLEQAFRRHFYTDRGDAVSRATTIAAEREAIKRRSAERQLQAPDAQTRLGIIESNRRP